MAPLNRSSSQLCPSSTLQHYIHPKHPLHLLNIPQEFICNGCSALGFGPRYRCHTCDFDLHEICATCPNTTPSPLHPHHPLTLVNHPVNDRFCDLCGDLVHGLFYTCRACEFDVHPLCTQLPLHVQLPLHPHHLLKLQPGSGPAGCALCFKACTFWRYRCDACSLDVHLECVLGGGGDDMSDQAAVTCQTRAVVPQPQQAGFGGCAMGIPVGGGGGGYGAYGGAEMMTCQPSKVEWNNMSSSSSSGRRRRRKIYTFVGRAAASAVITTIVGIPFGV
ncbi:hypothetical protein BUALT_Bualt01G0042100 [Buddleja alternifolia]|uniref:DC1 domain-containing protein n=1 Tax=Buddleja alternifolia TaxID=168488 RepID=A0AAV6Y6K6_9LAMI|nr:hypothetical protein BUALT_Bualt01G0042100 [Buddleja alternifolia]